MGNAFDRKMSDVSIAMLGSEVEELKKQTTDMNSFLDFFYPVGSYYETSNSEFDPNNEWGGVWELETSGQVHVSAGTGYTIGSTGGTSTVTLTAAQSGVPVHGHGFTAPSVTGGYSSNAISGGAGTTPSTEGAHTHTTRIRNDNKADGSGQRIGIESAYTGTNDTVIVSSGTHTHTIPSHSHSLPDHTHTVSGGSVNDSIAANASSAHNNMQPYIVVNRWHRTA